VLIDKFRVSFEEKERIALSKEIQRKVYDESSFIPMWSIPFYREGYWRYWRLPKVPGVKLGESSFEPFDSAAGGLFWLDQKLQTEVTAAMKSKTPLPVVSTTDTTYKK
jgi:microcin C transport system substrate-binding protein